MEHSKVSEYLNIQAKYYINLKGLVQIAQRNRVFFHNKLMDSVYDERKYKEGELLLHH